MNDPCAYIVVGLGYGDEGKGTMVDYLVRKHNAPLVVRFSGGPQAAHNVVTPEGIHHTFAQIGSGALAGADTHLSKGMLVDPIALVAEANVLASKLGVAVFDVLSRVTIDPMCRVILPAHAILNRFREFARGDDRHGSCGMGIDEWYRAQEYGLDPIYMEDVCTSRSVLESKIDRLRDYAVLEYKKMDRYVDIADLFDIDFILEELCEYGSLLEECLELDQEISDYMTDKCVVFEGAQGLMIDRHWGFHPYYSWTDTTTHGAEEFVGNRIPTIGVGVIRSYSTRHGLGPFVSERHDILDQEKHNRSDGFQGRFRVGHFDAVAFRYALANAGKIDEIAMTHMDIANGSIQHYVDAYSVRGTKVGDIFRDGVYGINTVDLMSASPLLEARLVADEGRIAVFESIINRDIDYVSFGPTWRDKNMVKKEGNVFYD